MWSTRGMRVPLAPVRALCRPRVYTAKFLRANSSLTDPEKPDKKVPSNRKKDEELENFSPDQSSRVSSPSGSLPGMNPEILNLMNKPKVEYNPLDNKKGTSYEFHAPKNPKEQYKEKMRERARGKSKMRKILPSLILGAGFLWGVYTYDYFTKDKNGERDSDSALLREDKFLPYVVSFRYQLDADHFLVELTRKNRAQKLLHNERLFSGDKIWSIEIAKPDINIVRSYTPLPLYVAGVDPITKDPHLRLVSKSEEEGKFIIIVKRYPDGEFSKWLTGVDLLKELKVRGPVVEYKFPFHPLDRYPQRPQLSNTLEKIEGDPIYPENIPKPENFVFYGAGTGIMPLLQVMYSPNPPKGFIDAYISLHSQTNILAQFLTLNYFAEKCGRAKFHYFYGSQGQHVSSKEVGPPTIAHFNGLKDMKLSDEAYRYKLLQEKKEEVRKQMQGKSTTPSSPQPSSEDIPKLDLRKIKPENAFQQFNFLHRRKELPPSSFAFVCGPDGYVASIAGKSDLNNVEGKDTAPVGGMLKERGWTTENVKRMVGL